MNSTLLRISILMLVAVGLALAALRVFSLGSPNGSLPDVSAGPPTRLSDVVVVSRALDAGRALRASDLRLDQWPAEHVPGATFRDRDALVGRVLRVEVVPGMPLTASALLPAGAGLEMDWQLEDGHRAMSIQTNIAAGVAGFAKPGSRVDVLAVLPVPSGRASGRAEPTSFVIATDRRILATDQEMERDVETANKLAEVVTLEVTPEEAQKILFASSEGDVHLSLRPNDDEGRVKSAPVAAGDFKAREKAPAKVAAPSRPRKPRPSVQVIRGLDSRAERI